MEGGQWRWGMIYCVLRNADLKLTGWNMGHSKLNNQEHWLSVRIGPSRIYILINDYLEPVPPYSNQTRTS